MENRMPCWYFEKEELENTPSFEDSISNKTEATYRSDGAEFISNLASALGLPCDTCATGMVIFQRYYLFHSFKSNPKYLVAACCLYLAGKIEETPKKSRDIVDKSRQLLNREEFSEFGSDAKGKMLSMEKILLKTIKFDFNIVHPYKHLLIYAKKLKDRKALVESLVQESWAFINNSFRTILCLKWEPEIIACAAMYLASKLNKHDILSWDNQKPNEKWWECFVQGMTVEVMEDVCHKILDEVAYRKYKSDLKLAAAKSKDVNDRKRPSLFTASSSSSPYMVQNSPINNKYSKSSSSVSTPTNSTTIPTSISTPAAVNRNPTSNQQKSSSLERAKYDEHRRHHRS